MSATKRPRTDEVDALMETVRQAAKALCEGVATLSQWALLAGTLDIAKAIEQHDPVRALREHLQCADDALRAVYARGDQLLGWCPVHLEFDELDAVQTFVDLYDFQMRQVSRSEFEAAANRAANQSRGQGAKVVVQRDLQRAAA
jgi:hypothetical protein